MPFVGRDWRSPGDQWVRTTEGWERLRSWRLKMFENLNENVVARLIRLALTMEYGGQRDAVERRQPYIFFHKGTTRERKELTSLSESLIRLDMTGAAKDIRRSNFVCKLLQMLLDDRLGSLSGTAQKHVFHILEATVKEALRTEINLGAARQLLTLARGALVSGQCHHIGSQHLWAQHASILCRLDNQLTNHQPKQRTEDDGLTLSELPVDCLRHIFYCIADHQDVIHAGQAARSFSHLSQEQLLWQQLCVFHFSRRQILTFLPSQLNPEDQPPDWKYLYRRCYKRFGKKDMYADMLAMCSHCCSLYWQSLGHPCISNHQKKERLLTPEDFIKLFPL